MRTNLPVTTVEQHLRDDTLIVSKTDLKGRIKFGFNRALPGNPEIDARLDAFDVHEHTLRPEVAGQPVVEAAGVSRRIIASIADENAIHPCPLC